jgi:hypothetical protein
MNPSDDSRESRAGDRAVAIAGFLAFLLVGFFGDEPMPAEKPLPVVSAEQRAQR